MYYHYIEYKKISVRLGVAQLTDVQVTRAMLMVGR